MVIWSDVSLLRGSYYKAASPMLKSVESDILASTPQGMDTLDALVRLSDGFAILGSNPCLSP